VGGTSFSGKNHDKSEANKGSTDYWIIKLDKLGNKIWDKTYGGNYDDDLQSVQQTADGGYILGGYSTSNKSGNKSEANKGSSDYWVIKLDATGNKQWDKTLGGDNTDWLLSLRQTPDGGYILGGSSTSNKSGDKSENRKGNNPLGDLHFDYWVVKINAQGTKEWDKTLGGNDDDRLAAVQQTSDGSYILGGSSQSPKGYDKSEDHKTSDYWPTYDYWLVKLNATGKKIWDKTLGGNATDQLTSLQVINDNGYLLGGDSNSINSGDKSEKPEGFWIIAVDARGNKLWDKTLSGKNYSALQLARDRSYILGGISTSEKN